MSTQLALFIVNFGFGVGHAARAVQQMSLPDQPETGLALTGPTLPGLGFLASPRGLVVSRRRLLELPAGSSLEATLARASRGAPRLAIAG
jgi:hypothetical protein